MLRKNRKLELELNRVVKNYNAKINRLSRSGKSGVYIPEKITRIGKQELKRSVYTAKDLRKRLRDLEYYTKKGGEEYIIRDGTKVPQSIFKSVTNYKRSLTHKLKAEYDSVFYKQATVMGKKENVTHAQALDENYLKYMSKVKLKEKTFRGLSVKEQEKFLSHLKSATKTLNKANFKESFIEMLLDSAYVHGISHERIHNLIEKIRSVSDEEFYEMFKKERSLQQIIYYYQTTNLLGVDESYANLNPLATDTINNLIDTIEDIMDFDIDEVRKNKEYERQAKEYIRKKYPDLDEESRMFKSLVFNKTIDIRQSRE